MLTFPTIDPVAFSVGPLAVRWYALAYLAGIVLGWLLVKWLHKRHPIPNLTPRAMEDMMLYAVLGIILGGRLGYVLFYNPLYYLDHPLQALQIWHGGMSFHGGMLGVFLAFFIFARRFNISYFRIMDVLGVAAPIGLFFGRLANFINGELYGRVTDSSWGMVFPTGGPLPRYPSQLVEAGLEGALLFAVLLSLALFTRALQRVGFISGCFLIGYASGRLIAEQFREPDAHLGFFFGHLTMGMLLSAPMIILGIYLTLRALKREPA